MSDYRRAFNRVVVSVPMALQICDPESHRPLGEPFQCRVVDVSPGGLRVEFPELTDHVAQLFGPGIILQMVFEPRELKLSSPAYLKVAWFRPATPRDASSMATMGAHFNKITDRDRAALLHFSTARTHGVERVRLRRSWVAVFALALLVGWVYRRNCVLESRIDELSVRVARAVETAEAAKSAVVDLEREGRESLEVPDEPEEILAPSREVSKPVAVVVLDAGVKPAAPEPDEIVEEEDLLPPEDSLGEPRRELKVVPQNSVNGIELSSVELLRGSFVGLLTSHRPLATVVTALLEYDCAAEKSEKTDKGAEATGKCSCEARLEVPTLGRAEFACTPMHAPLQELREVRVGLTGAGPVGPTAKTTKPRMNFRSATKEEQPFTQSLLGRRY